ncbi:restriction endonuclease subunit S [Legionella pneumophila serogroup 1]
MKPYQQYKASGISWIGEIPHHWSKLKLRSILKPVTVRNRPDLPLLSVVREKGVILRNVENKNENHNYIPDDLSNYKLVQKGQLAINKMKAWQGSYGLSNYEGIVSPAYYVFSISSGVFNYFFHLALRSKVYVPFFTSASDGVRVGQWDLNLNRMKEIPFYLPSNEEQQQIARYLDWKTTKINKFIKAKKKLIALLKEQKQNIINEAVTKGINPYVKMKKSGVDWLGEIPEHWEIRKLRFLINGKLKYGANSSGIEYKANLPRYIRITDFNSNGELDSKNKISLSIDNFEQYLLTEGDLLLARSGATVGKVFQCKNLTEPSCYAGYLIKAIPNTNLILSDYLYFYTQSLVYANWKNKILIKATIENISAEKYSQLLVTLPNINEQKLIIQKIITETSLTNKIILQAEKEIKLIQEYQARLISDVVTGKIDVRSIKIPDFEPIEGDAEISDEGITEELVKEDIEE